MEHAKPPTKSGDDTHAIKSALDDLRTLTKVDCDTLDVEVAKLYGPFQDCTSNQAIAFAELKKEKHIGLLQASAKLAVQFHSIFSEVKLEALGAEIATIFLSLQIVPYLHGCNHIQVDTFDARSTDKIIRGGLRIKALCERINPNYDASRLCVKIPSTWQGLRACRILERDHGIKTLATTLFGSVQAIVAGEAGCQYIAPYVHSLPDVMGLDRPDSTEEVRRMLKVAASSQEYYELQGLSTKVLPAALMTADECMALKGVHHITLSPARLQELDVVQSPSPAVSIIAKAQTMESKPDVDEIRRSASLLIEDEALFHLAMNENDAGVPNISMDKVGERSSLSQLQVKWRSADCSIQPKAIEIFNQMQTNLERMMAPLCHRAQSV